MKRFYVGSVLLLLALASVALTAPAQSAAVSSNPSAPRAYDMSKEVTLTGTISATPADEAKKSVRGSLYQLQTSSGPVTANLGRQPSKGKYVLALTAGKQVKVTGVMQTVKDKQVFMARVIQLDGQSYDVRSSHGFLLLHPVSTATPQRTLKGGSL